MISSLGKEVSPDTEVYGKCLGGYDCAIMVDDQLGVRIVPNYLLPWRIDESGDEQLTLAEISRAIKNLGLGPRIYVWENKPSDGRIYQCGNYKPDQWIIYGEVYGYA